MAFGAIMPIAASCSPESELLDTAVTQEPISRPTFDPERDEIDQKEPEPDKSDIPQAPVDDPASVPQELIPAEEPEIVEPTPFQPNSDPSSLTVIVNKGTSLPADYVPADLVKPDIHRRGGHTLLRQDAATALEEMNAAAIAEVGKPLQLVSGYRSFGDQEKTYARYVRKDGEDHADTYSARPGYSEHQTGLAADLSTVRGKLEKFGDTKLGEWTTENSWRFGFILRYTDENEPQTGYQSEPWHYRFIGKDLAAQYHSSGATSLEEFLGAPPAPAYYERSAGTPTSLR